MLSDITSLRVYLSSFNGIVGYRGVSGFGAVLAITYTETAIRITTLTYKLSRLRGCWFFTFFVRIYGAARREFFRTTPSKFHSLYIECI